MVGIVFSGPGSTDWVYSWEVGWIFSPESDHG